MPIVTSAFAQGLVSLTGRQASSSFESAFQNMQRTVINRTNDKIARLEEEYQQGDRERQALVKKASTLQDDLIRVQQYLSDNQSNFNRLENIITKITELQVSFGTDGDSSDVTAEDIAAFETLRDQLATQVDNLYYLTHPDVVKPYGIIHLKEELDSIKAMTPEIGADTDAANQAITDYLAELSNRATNAMDATRSTISMSSKLSLRYQASIEDTQSALATKATLATEELNDNIDNLKIEASNLLQAISLTYDAQAYSSNKLSDSIARGLTVEPTSILNIFV